MNKPMEQSIAFTPIQQDLPPQVPQNDDIQKLKDLLFIIRQHWLLSLLFATTVSGAYAYYKLHEAPLYKATTSILIDLPDKIVEIEGVADHSLMAKNDSILRNHEEKLNSESFLTRLIDSLSEEEKENMVKAYRTPETPSPSIPSIIRQGTSIGRARNSQIFSISVEHQDAKMASFLATKYAQEYINYVNLQSGTSDQSALDFLKSESDAYVKKVEQGERALQEYREKHKLVSLAENQNIIVERLKKLNADLTEIIGDRLELDVKVAQTDEAINAEINLIEIPFITQEPSVQEILNNINQAKSEKAALSHRYRHKHPTMVGLEAKLTSLNNALEEEIKRIVQDIRNKHTELKNKQEIFTQRLNEAETDALKLDRMAIEYKIQERKLEEDKLTLKGILARLNEIDISSKLPNTNIRVFDPAPEKGRKVRPNRNKIFYTTPIIFLIVFSSVPIGLELMNSRLRSTNDIENFLKKEVIGEIPEIKKIEKDKMPTLVLDDSDDSVVEIFGAMYSQIQLISNVEPPKTIIITSTIPSEGKSFIASNFGGTLSKNGLRVLLIDFDLRGPSLHRSFKLKNKHGLIAWKDAGFPLEGDVLKNEHLAFVPLSDNFYLLRAGGTTKRPNEIISNKIFHELLRDLKSQFDVVIMDTPPISVFPDILFLTEHADEIIYVCRQGKIARHKVRFFVDKLEQTNANLLGVLLNGTTNSNNHRYGYNYYYTDYKAYKKYYDAKVES